MHTAPHTATACHDQYVIKVVGEGKISATPDRALLTLGAVTEAKDTGTAQAANTAVITKIIDSLLQLGIPREDIKTTDYRIEARYDYVDGKQTFRGYQVTHLLLVTLNQTAQAGRVVDTAVASGANAVTNIQFTVARPEAYYNHALSLAMHNAAQKAATIARTLGVALYPIPQQVQEVSTPPEPVPFPIALAQKSEALPTPLLPGQLEIAATVRVDYPYVQQTKP